MTTLRHLPKLTKKRGLVGTIKVPGDKSLSHRSLMLGAVAAGPTRIKDLLFADDVLRTLRALEQLGISIEVNQGQSEVIIHGQGGFAFAQPTEALNMGNAGTATRLLLGLLSRQATTVNLVGDGSLSHRPLKRVTEPLRLMGAQIDLRADNYLPAQILPNTTLRGIQYTLPVASAQVKSAILLAGLQANGPTTVIEPVPTRDHTERLLEAFGAKLERQGSTITLQPRGTLQGQLIEVPGDLSSAAFFIVAALIIPGSHVKLPAVGINPSRTGILQILTAMGAEIAISQVETINGEPRATLTIQSQPLHGLTIAGAQVALAIDELPIIALAATQAQGKTVIRDAQELRLKETDRISAVVQELSKFGVQITEKPDGMVIEGPQRLTAPDKGRPLDAHGDHRLGMMLTIAALLTGQETTLQGAEAINISYPNFMTDLQSLL